MRPIVVVGSINMDLVTAVEAMPRAGETIKGRGFSTHPGGKGANQAVAAARLGQPVKMIGMVGADEFGRVLRAGLKRNEIDVAGVAVGEGGSGVASILVDAKGDNSIVVTQGANAQVSPTYLARHADVLRGAGIILSQLEVPLDSVLWLARFCAEEHALFVLDPAPAQPLPEEVFSLVSWFTPNETEAEFYLSRAKENTAQALLDMGCKGVILKQGARGASIATRDGIHHTRPHRVNAVDTTAAGDCFNGAFAAGLNQGMNAPDAAEFAAVAAALSVMRVGAQESMPTLDEVTSAREKHASMA